MIEIKQVDNTKVEKEELLELLLHQRKIKLGRELNEDENARIIKLAKWLTNSFLTDNLLAYENEKLVGWLGIHEAYPTTMLFYENHPMVKGNRKDKIAQKLLVECFNYAKNKGIQNTRVFVDVTESWKKRFEELKEYYFQAGMKQTHTVLCMENKLSKDKLKGIKVNSEYHVELAKDQPEEALKDCYLRIFTESADNFTNSLSEKERQYWNIPASRKFNEFSVVIKKRDEIVAQILAADYGDFMVLGPIGVIPEHRGKKLGKVLMEECLSRLIDNKVVDCYLEVDETNTPAINLYLAYGFVEVSKKHGFLYRW
ncbi:MAG: GNAT family N-acetyltransferase [Candidatus Heimdallarchaeota archaeon]|nr:GNAT family N-acetyltransferase [Candidatus Heimdallarchaeota archaeon]MCK4290733.1 GNAT family N-acetyltransferase [Candidatus Heimdallarchaeota archaeon]